mgnify:CR=1 FL=1
MFLKRAISFFLCLIMCFSVFSCAVVPVAAIGSAEKIFNVKSKTGSVNVPETYTGGICKIAVSSGSVTIRYK